MVKKEEKKQNKRAKLELSDCLSGFAVAQTKGANIENWKDLYHLTWMSATEDCECCMFECAAYFMCGWIDLLRSIKKAAIAEHRHSFRWQIEMMAHCVENLALGALQKCHDVCVIWLPTSPLCPFVSLVPYLQCTIRPVISSWGHLARHYCKTLVRCIMWFCHVAGAKNDKHFLFPTTSSLLF